MFRITRMLLESFMSMRAKLQLITLGMPGLPRLSIAARLAGPGSRCCQVLQQLQWRGQWPPEQGDTTSSRTGDMPHVKLPSS